MGKTLKKYNGRGFGGCGHLYIAAYSRADASRLLARLFNTKSSYWVNELRVYFSECWGNPMDGIECRRGIWVGPDGHPSGTPKQIYDGETERERAYSCMKCGKQTLFSKLSRGYCAVCLVRRNPYPGC